MIFPGPTGLFLGGALILLVLMLEVLWTTMGLGGGYLTKFIAHWIHRVILALYWQLRLRLILTWSGIAVVAAVFGVWISLLWLGWWLIFIADSSAVLNATTKLPADLWERLYYTGFSLFTLGLGDYQPQGRVWQVLTAVATLHGLFSVTFAITYLVPVVQAATQVRQTALTITSLGLSGQEILLNTWNGQDCSDLDQYLPSLVPTLAQIQQRHVTYPVLHYFHAAEHTSSLAVGLVALDEALTLVEHGVVDKGGLAPAVRHPARQVLTEFLETLNEGYIAPAQTPPPAPGLDLLRTRGIPVVSSEVFLSRVAALAKRRCLLAGFVHSKGWTWNDVQTATLQSNPDQPMHKRI